MEILYKNQGKSNFEIMKKIFLKNDDDCIDFIEINAICNSLRTESQNDFIQALKLLQKRYFRKANDKILSIFDANETFFLVVEAGFSNNPEILTEVLTFIINFSSKEEFAHRFVENRLFYLIQRIIHDDTYIVDCLSILINLSYLNVIYVKRSWEILTNQLFFSIISNNNKNTLIRCAKFSVCALQYDVPSIHYSALSGIIQIANQIPNKYKKIHHIILSGLNKYFEFSHFNEVLFEEFKIQYHIEVLYLNSNKFSNCEELASFSYLIIGKMLARNYIKNFKSQILFNGLASNNDKIEEKSFWCLHCALSHQNVSDFSALTNFLSMNMNHFINSSYKALIQIANAFILFINSINTYDFQKFDLSSLIILFLRFLQIYDNIAIQKESIKSFFQILKIAEGLNSEKVVKTIFMENNGQNIIENIIETEENCDFDALAFSLLELYSIE